MKKFYTIITLLVIAIMAAAAPVSKDEAKRKAEAFMAAKGKRVTKVTLARTAPRKSQAQSRNDGVSFAPLFGQNKRNARSSAEPAYYIFNAEAGNGFVIISGDDNTVDILGYSDRGTFSDDNIPANMQAMLDSYAEQISLISNVGETSANAPGKAASATAADRQPIAPLLKTMWDQNAPFNDLMPIYYDQYYEQYMRCATGCAATAMAQLLYYYRYPSSTTAEIPAYTSRGSDVLGDEVVLEMEALPVTTFDWDNMILSAPNSNTKNAAVAKLMKYVGQAMQMNYGNSSGVTTGPILTSVIDYFGYSTDARLANRMAYSIDEWQDLVYSELAAKRPVILCAQSSGGGHAFVCDGYGDSDYFHINWGWGGYYDGYFLLEVLNPLGGGTGASYTAGGYSMYQTALTHLTPATGLETTEGECYAVNTEAMVDGENVTFVYQNPYPYMVDFELGISITNLTTQEEQVLRTGKIIENIPTASERYIGFNVSQLTLPEGAHTIRLITRKPGTAEWGYDGQYQTCVLAEVDNTGEAKFRLPYNLGLKPTGFVKPEKIVVYKSAEFTITFDNSSNFDYANVNYLVFYKTQDDLYKFFAGQEADAFAEREGCYVKSKSSGSVTFYPTMYGTGDYNCAVLAQYNGVYYVVYSDIVTIEEDKVEDLGLFAHVSVTPGEESADAEILVYNSNSVDFAGHFYYAIFCAKSETSDFQQMSFDSTYCNIDSHGYFDFYVTFEDLNPDYYYIIAAAEQVSPTQYVNVGQSDVFRCTATGIESIHANGNANNGSSKNAPFYTIRGQRLNSKPTAPGIYISHGRKLLIK